MSLVDPAVAQPNQHNGHKQFINMSSLPYTDGSNGNGITDADELLRFLEGSPLAMFDFNYMRSYLTLLAPRRQEVMECFERATAGRQLQRSLMRIGTRQGVRVRARSIIRQTRANLELLLELAQVLSEQV